MHTKASLIGWTGLGMMSLLLFGQPGFAQGRSDTLLVGRVLEARTERPIPSAWVISPDVSRRAQTDSSGYFVLLGPGSGDSLFVRVEQVGYHPQEFAVWPGNREPIDIHLEPEPVGLEGLEVEAERTYEVRMILRERLGGYDFRSTVSGQLDLLTSDAENMVDYLWEETRSLLVSCPGDRWSWETSCMSFHGRVVPITLCIDDMRAPGGPSALYSFTPAELFRVEVLRDIRQVRV